MTVHLVHGFNVSDGGKDTVRRLEPFIPGSEIAYDYGWTGLLFLKCNNAKAIAHIEPRIKPGDILIGHSNGALIIWQLVQKHADKLAGVILINPALRRDTIWPDGLQVLCLYNSTDWVVQLGRIWARLVSLGGLRFHGWGAAGRYGFDQKSETLSNWDTNSNAFSVRVEGHSGLFKEPGLTYWGRIIARIVVGWCQLYGQNNQ